LRTAYLPLFTCRSVGCDLVTTVLNLLAFSALTWHKPVRTYRKQSRVIKMPIRNANGYIHYSHSTFHQ